MVKNKVVKFSTFGTFLSTRALGRKIRTRNILPEISVDFVLVFDFSGVDQVTHSFADECIGKLFFEFELDEIKSKTKFVNYNRKIEIQLLSVINNNVRIKSAQNFA